MMPSRPPCVTIGGQDYIAGDTVRYRLSEADPWRLGHVLALSQRDGSVQVEPARGLDRRPLWFYEEDAARLEPYAPPHPGATEVEDEKPVPPPPPSAKLVVALAEPEAPALMPPLPPLPPVSFRLSSGAAPAPPP